MIRAISGPHGKNNVYYIITTDNVQGVYLADGTKVRGKDVGETKDEIAYKIWVIDQPVEWKEEKLRQVWKDLTSKNKVV